MPKITVYKCPFTKKLFETRRSYRCHLLKLRAARNEIRIERRVRRQARDRISSLTANLRTAADIEKFIVESFHDILVAIYGADRMRIIKQMKIHWFRFDRITYSDMTRNTHSCPRNGQTNWGGRVEGAPHGYPGFSGQMSWKVTGPKSVSINGAGYDINNRIDMSYVLKYIGVHTGTGCPGWDGNISFELFADDFPGIKEEIANARENAKFEIFQSKLKGIRTTERDIITKHIRPIGATQKELATGWKLAH